MSVLSVESKSALLGLRRAYVDRYTKKYR